MPHYSAAPPRPKVGARKGASALLGEKAADRGLLRTAVTRSTGPLEPPSMPPTPAASPRRRRRRSPTAAAEDPKPAGSIGADDHDIPADPVAGDTCDAGDSFAATAARALAGGAEPHEAVRAASPPRASTWPPASPARLHDRPP
jgi:hypothetical protein